MFWSCCQGKPTFPLIYVWYDIHFFMQENSPSPTESGSKILTKYILMNLMDIFIV